MGLDEISESNKLSVWTIKIQNNKDYFIISLGEVDITIQKNGTYLYGVSDNKVFICDTKHQINYTLQDICKEQGIIIPDILRKHDNVMSEIEISITNTQVISSEIKSVITNSQQNFINITDESMPEYIF
jgi:hypothetical protein